MTTLGIFLLAHYRKALKISAIWRIIASSMAGVPIGIYFLSQVDQKISMTVLGIIIVTYALYALLEAFTHLIRLPELKHAAWAYLVGFLAGILGGAYNTSGPPVILYGHSKRWPTAEFKSNLQGFFMISNLIIVLGHAWNHNFSATIWDYFLWSIPAMIVGMIAGTRLDKYINPETFRRVVLVLFLIMGIRLILA
jgi:hypothetical protein